MEVILTQGVPGSGKTTWAKQKVRHSEGKVKRLSKDDMRSMIDSGIYNRENEFLINALIVESAKHFAKIGIETLIIDSCNMDQHIEFYKERLPECTFKTLVFDIHYNTCRKRNSNRINPIPEEDLRLIHQGYINEGILRAKEESWYGFDLDGTLAYYDGWKGNQYIGEPIKPMVELFHRRIAQDMDVKIMTARAERLEDVYFIQEWLIENDLPIVEITNVKDYCMVQLYDDLCYRIAKNTGRFE